MTNLGALPYQAVISVVNTSNVTIEGLAIDASHNSVPAACNVTLAAVHFYNSSGSVVNNAISNVGKDFSRFSGGKINICRRRSLQEKRAMGSSSFSENP